MKLIFDSFDSPVNESTPLSEDAKERLASVAGKSPPLYIYLIGNYP